MPDGIVSTGWPAVRDTNRRLGVIFDEWQDGLGRAILAKRADGLYAADTVVISIPRQVGKTFLIAAIIFALCIIQPGTLVIWTAHRFKTARETFMALKGMALRKVMRAHVDPDNIYSGSGNESIGFRNGSRILFGARERGFGRGFSKVKILIFDEAQILAEAAMEDMVPATNAADNPLIILTGTPPRPNDPGEVFTSLRREALAGESEGVLYAEFSADADADPRDREQWAKANPSYPFRTDERAVLRMMKNLTQASFVREGMGVWDDDAASGKPVPLEAWLSLTSMDEARPSGVPAFFVAVAKEMQSASIAVAALRGGVPHVELADHDFGVEWLTRRLRGLHERYPHAKFAAYAAGPAKAWVPILAEPYKGSDGKTKSGFELDLLSGTVEAAACAHIQKLVKDRGLTHSANPVVVESLRGAEKRDMDGASWKWDWKNSEGDLAPIAAVTGALWVLESTTVSLPQIF